MDLINAAQATPNQRCQQTYDFNTMYTQLKLKELKKVMKKYDNYAKKSGGRRDEAPS